MKFLKDLRLKNLIKTIQSDHPKLIIKNYRVINDGWDFLVLEVNHEYIFRFPRQMKSLLSDYKTNTERMRMEINVLDNLKGKTSLTIPKVIFQGKKYAYFGYKKILGKKLTPKMIKSLDKRQYQKLICDLTNFLFQIHSSIDAQKAKKLKILRENYASYSNLIIAKILKPKKIKDKLTYNFITKIVLEYQTMIRDTKDEAFLYNDLHGDNMAFDTSRQKLNGVFDFSDVMFGDINLDFNPLCRFGLDFVKQILNEYSRVSGKKNLNVRKIFVYYLINGISDLASVIYKPKSKVYRNGLKEIKQWARINSLI
jgi:aminoglycoside 2''-phosphotransferase